MIKNLEYEEDFIELMSNLSKINKQVLITNHENDDGTVDFNQFSIKAVSEDNSIVYFLNAPKRYFNFESTSFAVIDFTRIVNYYNTFNKSVMGNKDNVDSPKLSIEYKDDTLEEAITLFIDSTKTKSKIKHRLANESIIERPPYNKINIPSIDAEFNLSLLEQNNLLNMIKLVDADYMKYKFYENKLNIILGNTRSHDTYDTVFELVDFIETPFELTTNSSGFVLMPKSDYKVKVSEKGLFMFNEMRDDDIKLTLYITRK